MTNREYILGKLSAFGVSEADLADMSIDLDAQYVPNDVEVGKTMIGIIEERLFAPYQSNINENGFSVSWNRENLGKYYLWLTRRYRIKPNGEVQTLIGISSIKDVSSIW